MNLKGFGLMDGCQKIENCGVSAESDVLIMSEKTMSRNWEEGLLL